MLDAAVGDGVFPGACARVSDRRGTVFEHATGTLAIPGADAAVGIDTVWDLASLTKPLITAAITILLAQRGLLRFTDRIVDLVPQFARSDDPRRGNVTIRHLLRHDSGLPAHRRFYEGLAPDVSSASGAARRREEILAAVLQEPLERDPGSGSVYSDIGFLVLGCALERVTEKRIDVLAREMLLEPLGVGEAWYVDVAAAAAGRSPLPLQRTAATGHCAWRGRLVHGVVQDQNSYALGGITSHAGLFATVSAAERLAREWIDASYDHGRVLDARVVRYAWRRQFSDEPGTWVLGWDTPSAGASSAGTRISAQAVGHLGYTGTSVWIDRRRAVHVLLLTNRVASDTTGSGIRALRPRFHDAVLAAVDAERAGKKSRA